MWPTASPRSNIVNPSHEALHVASPTIISHNPNGMINRIFRFVMLLVWFELGLMLILVPWSNIWDVNYFLYQYPYLGFFVKNPFLRGAISGLGFMNVLFSIGAFRRRAIALARRA